MTWINRIEGTVLEITTGDGVVYKPLYKEPKKQITYNVDGFDFVGVEGTFVQRETRQGTQYPMTLYFQGEDNIEQSNAFEKSARDKRPWKIKHPIYDIIFCQPLSLEIDDSNLNVSIITLVVWETIDTKYPTALKSLSGSVLEGITAINIKVTEVLTENLKTPTTGSVSKITNANAGVYDKYQQLAKNPNETNTLKGLFREASGSIQDYTNDVSSYMTKTQNLINFPFQSLEKIEFKIDKIIDQYNSLKSIFITDNVNDENKQLFDANATSQLTIAAGVSSFPTINDYKTRSEVVRNISRINALYSDYLSTLDSLTYNQNPDVAIQLDSIINTTIANLYDIAFNSKQERIIYLDADTNIVLLAHKYFGTGDDKLNEFIELNEIQLSEYLQIKKGRQIKYLV